MDHGLRAPDNGLVSGKVVILIFSFKNDEYPGIITLWRG